MTIFIDDRGVEGRESRNENFKDIAEEWSPHANAIKNLTDCLWLSLRTRKLSEERQAYVLRRPGSLKSLEFIE